MSKLPSFQFYPGDWLRDPNLRSVSIAARGLWIDLLCVMFQSEKVGYLQINDKPPSEMQLARMVNCPVEEMRQLLSELTESAVLSISQHGFIYSRRMVRDAAIRNKRSKCGLMGGNPNFKPGYPNPYYLKDNQTNQKDKQIDNQRDKQKITPSSSSSSSSSDIKEPKGVIVERKEITPKARFDALWESTYLKATGEPYKYQGSRDSKAVYELIRMQGYTVERLIEIARNAWSVDSEKSGWYCIKQSKTISGFNAYFNNIRNELGIIKVLDNKPAETISERRAREAAETKAAWDAEKSKEIA